MGGELAALALSLSQGRERVVRGGGERKGEEGRCACRFLSRRDDEERERERANCNGYPKM